LVVAATGVKHASDLFLENFPNLTELDASSCPLQEDNNLYKYFEKFKNLQVLKLRYSISSVEQRELSILTHLQILDI